MDTSPKDSITSISHRILEMGDIDHVTCDQTQLISFHK